MSQSRLECPARVHVPRASLRTGWERAALGNDRGADDGHDHRARAEKVKELLAAENDPALTALRVAVEGGGCSGFQYALGFDGAPEENDETWEYTACA